MHFTLFENEYYPHGITIVSPFGSDKKQVLNFCAQSAEELLKFLEDLKESIAEVSEMEQIRIECKQDLDENSGHNAVELTVSYHRTRKSRRFQRRRGRGGTSRWRSSNQTA
uniref:IQ motif and SEC7 domain-containing protein n=1 Tax=Hucho hucho TaxID=62062 RepID=A0A4W5RAV7_9TELE